jgi:hypothetical protein
MRCIGGPLDGADVRLSTRDGEKATIPIVKQEWKLFGDKMHVWAAAQEVEGVAHAAVRAVYEARKGFLRHVRTLIGSAA